MGRMYPETRTWNPFLGCEFDCSFCGPSFKKTLRWIGRMQGCQDCYNYKPHYHPKRLHRGNIPNSPIVFVYGQGDIVFCRPEYVRRTFAVIREKQASRSKSRDQWYYWQSKAPKCLEQYLDEYPDNSILVTTLETNRDIGYEEISKAPKPSVRFRDFLSLDYPRKVVTIEPVMDFDSEIFLDWILQLKEQGSLLYIWIGFNSRPHSVNLPEPSEEKVWAFIDELKKHGIEVRGKDLRGVLIE